MSISPRTSYLGEHGAPLALSVVLPERNADPRWNEVVEPRPGVYMPHLELRAATDIDDQVKGWLTDAYAAAQSSTSTPQPLTAVSNG